MAAVVHNNEERAFGQNTGRRIWRTRHNLTVLNGINDTLTLSHYNTVAAKRPGDVFYKRFAGNGNGAISHEPLRIPLDHNASSQQPFTGEFVVVKREARRLGQRPNGPHSGLPRGMDNQSSVRLPVSAVLNGAPGKSRSDLQQLYLPVGVAELTGRDTRQNGMSILAGGVLTVSNMRAEPIFCGDYIMVVPPTQEEAGLGQLLPPAGNGANVHGRVPYVGQPFNPLEINYYDPALIRNTLLGQILEAAYGDHLNAAAGAAGGLLGANSTLLRKRMLTFEADTAASKNELLVHRLFRQNLEKILDYHTKVILLANDKLLDNNVALTPLEKHQLDANMENAVHKAACFMLGATASPDMLLAGADYFSSAAFQGLIRCVNIDGTAVADGAVVTAIKRSVSTEVLTMIGQHAGSEKRKFVSGRPIDHFVRHTSNLRKHIDECVIGVAVSSAGPRNDYELHLRAYGG